MYIPEFWAGVAATVFVEMILFVVVPIINGIIKSRRNKKDE